MKKENRQGEQVDKIVGLVVTRKGETAEVKAIGTRKGEPHTFALLNSRGSVEQVIANAKRWRGESGVYISIVDEA